MQFIDEFGAVVVMATALLGLGTVTLDWLPESAAGNKQVVRITASSTVIKILGDAPVQPVR